MDVNTITIDRDLARQKLREYAAIPPFRRTPGDSLLVDAYRAAARGLRLLNVQHAMHTCGLNVDGQPKLAMARADWPQCVFHPHTQIGTPAHVPGAGVFTRGHRVDPRLRTNCFSVPADTWNAAHLTRSVLYSPPPHIPLDIRPRPSALKQHFILFEVECWEQYPADPFLLRHVAGPFYSVVAEWELTPLEGSLLSALVS